MATTTATRKPATKSRIVTVLEPITATTGDIQITQTEGRQTTIDRYYVREIPSDIGGRGFTFGKMAQHTFAVVEEHTCRLAGRDSTCECKGFERWSHCKHLESLTALANRGKLPAEQSQPVCV